MSKPTSAARLLPTRHLQPHAVGRFLFTSVRNSQNPKKSKNTRQIHRRKIPNAENKSIKIKENPLKKKEKIQKSQ